MRFLSITRPSLYAALLFLIYIFAFIPSPLGWSRHILVDERYLPILFLYIASFLIGGLASISLSKKYYTEKERAQFYDENFFNRFNIVFIFSLSMTIAQVIKIGNFALLSENKLIRSMNENLGGYIDYPSDLITPLAVLSIFAYTSTRKNIYISYFILATLIQTLQLNRLEVLICIIGGGFAYFTLKKVRLGTIVTTTSTGIISLYLLIGGLQILRHGSDKLSRTLDAVQLPFWIIHGDLTDAMRLGHYITDIVEPGALAGRYSFGAYLSVVIPNFRDHGAEYIRANYTEAQTAQSISAPFSYFLDGGYLMVSAVGAIQGAIAAILWKTARRTRNPFWMLLYVIQLFWLLWTLRAGSLSIPPVFLYQAAAMLFVCYGLHKAQRIGAIPMAIIVAFLATIPVSTLFMIARL